MAENKRVMVEDLIDGAIIEGFQRGSFAFMESIEDSLRTDILVSEAGDVQSMLQNMIDEAEHGTSIEQTTEQIQELSEKLSRVIKRQ